VEVRERKVVTIDADASRVWFFISDAGGFLARVDQSVAPQSAYFTRGNEELILTRTNSAGSYFLCDSSWKWNTLYHEGIANA
jgi:hypothetical protein